MITISQAAKELGVSVSTLRIWDKSGKLSPEKTASGHRRYDIGVLKPESFRAIQQEERKTMVYARVSGRIRKKIWSDKSKYWSSIAPGRTLIPVPGNAMTPGNLQGFVSGNRYISDVAYTPVYRMSPSEGLRRGNPFGFTGYQSDAVTGLWYAQARYYAPSLGRFGAEDTHWHPGNMIYGDADEIKGFGTRIPHVESIVQSGNLHAYVMGNPLRWIDPEGMEADEVDSGDLVIGVNWSAFLSPSYGARRLLRITNQTNARLASNIASRELAENVFNALPWIDGRKLL